MKLEILLALWLVTTICSASVVPEQTEQQEAEPETQEEEPTEPENFEDEFAELIRNQGHRFDDEDPLPRPHPHQLEDDKRGMDVHFYNHQHPDEQDDYIILCTGWIEELYRKLALSEERDTIVYSDFLRLFLAMDKTGDGTGVNVSYAEFKPYWKKLSGFGDRDTEELFYTRFAITGDPGDPDHINDADVEMLWELLFYGEFDGAEMTKEFFKRTWETIILPELTNHGCHIPEGEEPEARAEGRPNFRPDVYGYFKRKRK